MRHSDEVSSPQRPGRTRETTAGPFDDGQQRTHSSESDARHVLWNVWRHLEPNEGRMESLVG